MRHILLASLVLPLLAAPAFSQSTTTPSTTQPGTTAPMAPRPGQAMPAPTGSTGTAAGLTPGANSFTESQARARLVDKGFTAVSALKQDKDGVWRGTATKDAKSVAVGIDFKGEITGG